MYTLKKSEAEICKLADADPAAAEAIMRLAIRYENVDGKSFAHSVLISAIYLKRSEEQVWKLAQSGHISESTAYRYRKTYIETFYNVYNQLKPNG